MEQFSKPFSFHRDDTKFGSMVERLAVILAMVTICLTLFSRQNVSAQGRIQVAIELVLAVDTSLSVDPVEFDLQIGGIARAFRRPEIISLIAQHRGGVAVTVFQWSSTVDPAYVIPWTVLDTPRSVLAFAEKIARVKRDPVKGFTALGRALGFGIDQIVFNQFEGRQLKIDVSGDGRNNTGQAPAIFRRMAQVYGITINGLPILIDTYKLDTYFQEKVISGPGAFIETATDYRDFADAFYRKLTRELTPMTAERMSNQLAKPASATEAAQ
ncbi:MAG: DUF1194 domain-containing protein [Alphaproteobacteria bacterium]|nr:DUF1194 domain-containing protein [Alphaproteobacteria bacterium]